MKIIEVEEFTPPTGNEYTASVYPHEGVFVGAVYGSRTLIIFRAGVITMAGLNGIEPKEMPVVEAAPPAVVGISETTLLKTIAILTGKAVAEVTL